MSELPTKLSRLEFLDRENQVAAVHEFRDREVFAMWGIVASRLTALNIASSLHRSIEISKLPSVSTPGHRLKKELSC